MLSRSLKLEQQTPQSLQPVPLLHGAAFVNHCVHSQLQQLAEVQWKIELSAKLAAILEKLRERFAMSQNVCLCQVRNFLIFARNDTEFVFMLLTLFRSEQHVSGRTRSLWLCRDVLCDLKQHKYLLCKLRCLSSMCAGSLMGCCLQTWVGADGGESMSPNNLEVTVRFTEIDSTVHLCVFPSLPVFFRCQSFTSLPHRPTAGRLSSVTCLVHLLCCSFGQTRVWLLCLTHSSKSSEPKGPQG